MGIKEVRRTLSGDDLLKSVREDFTKAKFDITDEMLQKVFNLLISSIAKCFYDVPDVIYEFPYFRVRKLDNISNLFKVEISRNHPVKNAEDLLKFYTCGGAEIEQFNDLMDEFVDSLVEYSTEKESESVSLINKINRIKEEKGRKKHGN